MKNKNIHFAKVDKRVSSNFYPKPAKKLIPQWYKDMESRFPEGKERNINSLSTVKKCMPVFDSLTSGYIIETWCDISIIIEDGEPRYRTPFEGFIEENSHPRKQAYKHPAANEFKFPKFINPWAIKTPSGYSCLFVPPMNNSNEWFECLPGIVDTDKYNAPVNFPFILKNPGKEIIIPAGTPIIQVIPFKRDSWTHNIFENDSELSKKADSIFFELRSKIFDSYKNKYWSPKDYK